MDGCDADGGLAGRVAVLKRFRRLLLQQRDRFNGYADLLERQEAAIASGSGDSILAHAELESRIVEDIFAIQRVIDPLEEMYRAVARPGSGDDGIPELKVSLDRMRDHVREHSEKNRRLLSRRMDGLRAELDVLKDNPFLRSARRQGYSGGVTASLLDMEG